MQAFGQNRALVVWAACLLWLMSTFQIIWSLVLFFAVGDILYLTSTDLVNSFVLLSGVMMMPINLHILYAVSQGRTVNHKDRVICCPLWLAMLCVFVVNMAGAVVCMERTTSANREASRGMRSAMGYYGHSSDVRHVIDKIQWSLKCCGDDSYEDWFKCDWQDQAEPADEEDPSPGVGPQRSYLDIFPSLTLLTNDSVPFSCCKAGTCVATFLEELGASAIYKLGCGAILSRIVTFSMTAHWLMFVTLMVTQAMLLRYIIKWETDGCDDNRQSPETEAIMPAKENFIQTSGSHIYTSMSFDGAADIKCPQIQKCVASKIQEDLYKRAALFTSSSDSHRDGAYSD